MGIAERKTRQRAELREQILTAARRLVARDGYEALTMRKIADEIEYSPATIYLYFESREEIGRQLVREGFAELIGYMSAAAAIADPIDRLNACGRAYVRFGVERPEAYKLIFMTDPRYAEAIFGGPHLKSDENAPGRDAFGLLVSIVVACQDAGRIAPGDPTLVAETLWCAMHGVVSMALSCPDACVHPVDAVTSTMLAALTFGFDVQR